MEGIIRLYSLYWALPLLHEGIVSTDTPIEKGAAQLRSVCTQIEARPISVWDSEYGCASFLLATADIEADKLIRIRPNRCRRDYGSTWEGEIEIRNCRWIPACGDETTPHLVNVSNDGIHDFGYPCFMPEQITIDGLQVEDSNTPDGYEGMYFFTDPDGFSNGVDDIEGIEERPYPYEPTRQVNVRGLTTASGKAPRVSPNAVLCKQVTVKES